MNIKLHRNLRDAIKIIMKEEEHFVFLKDHKNAYFQAANYM